MKRKIQSLLLTMMLGMVIISCNDDDEAARSNAYEFDGQKKDIKTAIWYDETHGEEGGGYTFIFSAEEFSEDLDMNEYIEIDIPRQRMGTKFELTEEDPYNWSWWFEFWNSETEIYYSGFGDEGAMEDVKSGTMYAINKGDNNFEFEADITFNDGKTLKVYYSGNMVNLREDNSRKATRLKKNSLNK